VTGVPAQTPAVHTSAIVQALPSSQTLPFGAGGLAGHVPVLALQVACAKHGFAGIGHVTSELGVHVPA
jgi:hypothetical protein